MLVFKKITYWNEKSVSETTQNCFMGEGGVRAQHNGLKSESTIFFRNFFLSVPGTFGDDCTWA